jgi:hypothetical protein
MIATKNKSTTPKVGDIITCSWGYDQTNVDFYKVTKVTAKTVSFVRITADRKYDGPMHGHSMPDPTQIHPYSRAQTRRWSTSTHFGWSCKCDPGGFAHLWDGKPEEFSEWA